MFTGSTTSHSKIAKRATIDELIGEMFECICISTTTTYNNTRKVTNYVSLNHTWNHWFAMISYFFPMHRVERRRKKKKKAKQKQENLAIHLFRLLYFV